MSMPDDELRRLADQGQLRDPRVLAEQTRRLLSDPKARAFTSAFLGQWLGYDGLAKEHVPNPAKFLTSLLNWPRQ